MRKVCLALLAATVVSGAARPAFALLQFYQVFDKTYLAENANEEFVKEVRDPKARCLICHQGMRSKKNRNPYGVAVSKLLTKKDAKNVEKITAALAEVGALHSDPKDEASPTYDELIKAGKFPGGALEDLKAEPPRKP